jgi:serpin B
VIKELAESSMLNNRGWCDVGGNTFNAYEVDLKLPRFETDSDTDDLDIDDGLIGLMQKMGIKRAFIDGLAEIPNMCEGYPLYIDMMRQKAKIKVNEEGSEAAAITVAAMNYKSASVPPEYPKATFHANRPFVYVIREASSGVILFVGKFTGA